MSFLSEGSELAFVPVLVSVGVASDEDDWSRHMVSVVAAGLNTSDSIKRMIIIMI